MHSLYSRQAQWSGADAQSEFCTKTCLTLCQNKLRTLEITYCMARRLVDVSGQSFRSWERVGKY